MVNFGRTSALVASATLHAAVAWFALTRQPAPAVHPHDPVQVTIVWAPPPKPPAPIPAHAPPPTTTRHVRSPARAIEPPRPGPPPVAAVEPAPLRVEPTPPTPLLPATPPPKIELFPPLSPWASTQRGLPVPAPNGTGVPTRFGRLPGETAGENARTDGERIAARITGTSLDANAKTRVRMGLVDPAYTRLGRALLDAWDPERALHENSAALWMKQRAQNAVVSTQLMLETASRYAATGSPMVAGEELDEEVRSDRHDATSQATGSDQQRSRETFRQYLKGKFNEGRTAQLLVEETPDGRIGVSLVKGSGDDDVDAGALEDLHRALERLRADQGPPPHARRTLWSLRLQIIIHPPVPIGGFTFDEVLESPKLELPLGRKLLKRLRLEAVYDDDPRLEQAVASP